MRAANQNFVSELSTSGLLPNLDRVRGLVRLLSTDDAVSALIRSCNRVGEAFLFGGLVRDAMFGSAGVFGDVDIFVSGPLDEEFLESISTRSRRTNFGGMRLVVGKYDVDIWELPKSYAFRVEKGRAISVNSLLNTVCFSTDSVAVSLLDSRVLSTPRFRRSLSERVVSFVIAPTGLELLPLVRIARIIVKNSVRPDPDVAKYFLKGFNHFGASVILDAELKWKGRRVLDSFLLAKVVEVCADLERGVLNEQDELFV